MKYKSGPTEFASGKRSSSEEIERQSDITSRNVTDNTMLRSTLNSIFDIVLILNRNRQSVFVNEALLRYLKVNDLKELLGYRPGEIFNCVNAEASETGCGTTSLCRFCTAANAILIAQEGRSDVEECEIVQQNGNVLSLVVSATPVSIEGEPFVVFAIRDISDKKRRETLEGVFFHDVLNTASVISTLAELIKMNLDNKGPEFTDKIISATKRLIDDIQWQENLFRAETNDVQVRVSDVDSLDIMNQTVSLYSETANARGIKIKIEVKTEEASFKSDPVLLRRVLGNLLKNAIEASSRGDVIKIGCKPVKGSIEFSIHNNSALTEEVQINLFRRPVSTKGQGRGIGIYSVKMFAERYLKGKVNFKSQKSDGTTFYINLPLSI